MEKCYVFVNYYVQGRQVGIQAAHAIARLCRSDQPEVSALVDYWLDNHETIVVLNGGDHMSLRQIKDQIIKIDDIGAVEYFTEIGLDNAMTAVAYIPCKKMFDTILRAKDGEMEDTPEFELASLINKFHTHRG